MPPPGFQGVTPYVRLSSRPHSHQWKSVRGSAAVLCASGASVVAGGPAPGLDLIGVPPSPTRVGASRLGLWLSPGGIRVGLLMPRRSLSYSSSETPADSALGCRAAVAGFRVVSASHTSSGRKFQSHRNVLRASPQLLDDFPATVLSLRLATAKSSRKELKCAYVS